MIKNSQEKYRHCSVTNVGNQLNDKFLVWDGTSLMTNSSLTSVMSVGLWRRPNPPSEMHSALPPDSLGVISPITVWFKLLFQQLYETKTDWDEPLTGGFLTGWKTLASDPQLFEPMLLPRCYTGVKSASIKSYSLQGFCDASQSAYSQSAYATVAQASWVGEWHLRQISLLKDKGSTCQEAYNPLELLSALLLARLALKHKINLGDSICYTDSQVALCWILGVDKEWKQFVECSRLENLSQQQVGGIAVDFKTLLTFL